MHKYSFLFAQREYRELAYYCIFEICQLLFGSLLIFTIYLVAWLNWPNRGLRIWFGAHRCLSGDRYLNDYSHCHQLFEGLQGLEVYEYLILDIHTIQAIQETC